jgi:hypothetical protein
MTQLSAGPYKRKMRPFQPSLLAKRAAEKFIDNAGRAADCQLCGGESLDIIGRNAYDAIGRVHSLNIRGRCHPCHYTK